MSVLEQILSLIGAAVGSSALSVYIASRAAKKQVSADAADSVADSAKLLVETMRVDLMYLKEEIKAYRAENLILQKRVFELEAELKFYKTLGAINPNAVISSTTP